MSLLLALALAAAPVDERALMCRGPVSVIADDDPGLVLYPDVRARKGLEEAKVELAMDRGESCGDSEQNVLKGVSVSTIAAAVEHICQENDEGRECRMLRDATQPLSAVTYQQRAEAAERALCANGVNDGTEEGPSCD